MTSPDAPAPAAAPPSGQQYEISAGSWRATVVEVGGGLRELTCDGVPVIDGYAADAMASGGRGQVLLPWPNRIDSGRYTFAGQERQLALTEPARGNAIHGLTRWVPWTAAETGPDRVTMQTVVHPQPGYPHTLELRCAYSLAADGLTLRTSARNLGDGPAPFGCGTHPYVLAGTPKVDTALLRVPASTRLRTDGRGIPVGREPVEGTPYDFRAARAVGDVQIDSAFCDLERDADGLVRLTLAGTRTVVVWQDEAYPWLQVFTGDTLPDPARRGALGVEPMSCPPNAFVSGEDLVVLEPGGEWSGSWGITLG